MTEPRPRILLTRRWPEAVEQRIAERYDVVLNTPDVPLDQAALAAAMHTFDAICPTVSDRIDGRILDCEAPRVRIIANYGVGTDHIDTAAARERGIVVTNTPGVLTDATADLAVTLMLMATRRAGEGERELRAGRWTGWRPTHLVGTGLRGKMLGLVGFGRIAQATAERARGFGMEIAYFAQRPASAEIAERLGARYFPDLAELAGRADVLSLHVPGGAATRHMIDGGLIARMPRHAVLVNTARGEVVEHDALVHALRSGRIAAAGLDVFPNEPEVPAGLLALENVVLLPHLGSATREAREGMGMRVLANLDAWFAGQAPPDRVA